MSHPTPEAVHKHYRDEVELIVSAQRTQSPTVDPKSPWFALPYAEFVEVLSLLRDEVEQRAYLALVAATEAVLQVDFRSRTRAKRKTLLTGHARALLWNEKKYAARVVVEDVLDAWKNVPGARKAPISEFRQLLTHRHWLAHGRYFENKAGVATDDPDFVFHRVRACLDELKRLDPAFPRE